MTNIGSQYQTRSFLKEHFPKISTNYVNQILRYEEKIEKSGKRNTWLEWQARIYDKIQTHVYIKK